MAIEYKQDGIFIDGTRYHYTDKTVFTYYAECGKGGGEDYYDDEEREESYTYHIKRNEKDELYLLEFILEKEGDKEWSQYKIRRDKSFNALLEYIRDERESFDEYILNEWSNVGDEELSRLPKEDTLLKLNPELRYYSGSSEEPNSIVMKTEIFYCMYPPVDRLVPLLSYFGPVKW